ncbi:hypothetical protein SAMN05443377_11188 [Propionibacterium cyclohexanicum]|uniref:THUMP-like domain-containing protein n=1 Tax=Propionibacterium cyclohexanicum TaxID=64702 RepID=A0A1H9S7R3_9ACTN|nr:class I SAM-dependent methyltransferase [Propionibacterium cyclohexanicum]SER80991.1 hypothetical protein SAMN05443377_11188 [Propionibacterium cyclohexanicum]
MDIDTARALVSPLGEQALRAAAELLAPESLAAGEAMRRDYPPALAAAALTQIQLRRAAEAKLGERAGQLLWTRDGLEQATRGAVARWRARRMAGARVRTVLDLGCGIGSDALAFLDAGLGVVAVEADPATAVLAAHNLPGAQVICADATAVADELIARAGPHACVFLDPARRTARGRSWRVEDLSPPWSFVLAMAARRAGLCVKLGPGIAPEILPAALDALWVSEHGELVECGLWALPATDHRAGQRGAVLLPQGLQVTRRDGADELPVGPLGHWLYEPDPAVSRAGALSSIGAGLRRLHPQVAYLAADEPIDTGLATGFEVIDVLDPATKVLRRWVGEHEVGRLEIKKRAVQVDPAQLRRALRPRGPHAATLILTPTSEGTRALVVRRMPH